MMPSGRNVFRDQFERVLPASSVANLYPFNYSGKTDPHGFYVGRDKFGSNILVDFNQRADDKTNGSILILGNSGQGKSYLLKLILCNLREARLSQHISFLKDFFRSYKDFTDREIDVIEIMVQRLYAKCGLTDETDFQRLGSKDYPTLSELYELIEAKYKGFDSRERQLYTAELLQNILLGLHSMCRGPEEKFFNGHTNITDSSFVTFGVKGVLQASRNLRDALLFNTLSFMSNRLLTVGDTVAGLDEFYLFLSNLTAVEYVRNFMKRVRKKNSSVILASQNLEDFNIEGIREYTKPLFSIPTHQFLFNAGAVDEKFYTDTLQLEASEFSLIRYPQRGVCPVSYTHLTLPTKA